VVPGLHFGRRRDILNIHFLLSTLLTNMFLIPGLPFVLFFLLDPITIIFTDISCQTGVRLQILKAEGGPE